MCALSTPVSDKSRYAIRDVKLEAATPPACSIGGEQDFDPQILQLAPGRSGPKKFTQRRRFFFHSTTGLR
jgi:hypothetical protein